MIVNANNVYAALELNNATVSGQNLQLLTNTGNFGAMLQSLFGGNISIYTALAERARGEAFDNMIAHAQEHGANAIIAMR